MERKIVGDNHRVYNDINENFAEIYDKLVPKEGQILREFDGGDYPINLSRQLTSYQDFTVEDDIEIVLALNPEIIAAYPALSAPMTGGGAEIILIADGSHTPTFFNITKSSGSEDWDTTLGRIHKTIFYYDGAVAYYSHTILNPD